MKKNQLPSVTDADEMNHLHEKILNAANTMLADAISLGKHLAKKKDSLDHGDWIPWVESNLKFGRSQAANYIRVYERRAELPNVHSAAHLTLSDAVKLLAEPSGPPAKPQRTLAEIQAVISTAKPLVDEVCLALKEVRDRQLFKCQFETFGEFCNEQGLTDETVAGLLAEEENT